METGSLTAEELAQVQALKERKYDTWDWTYGRSPRFTFTYKHKWPGGILEVGLQVINGIVAEVRFYGDFLSLTSLDVVVNTLRGAPYRQDELSSVSRRFRWSGISVPSLCRRSWTRCSRKTDGNHISTAKTPIHDDSVMNGCFLFYHL